MELFDKRFVHFMWDDELEGKRGFLSSGIDTLIKMVNKDSDRTEIQEGCERDLPFCKHTTVECRFAYYDPNYEAKRAFNEGKKIQVRCANGIWSDCGVTPKWYDTCEYRIKPEEKKWIVYLARQGDEHCYLTACREDIWKHVQKEQGAKTKLFVGSAVEATAWYESRQKFVKEIKAWEDGKTIQFLSRQQQQTGGWIYVWYDCVGPNEPLWDVHLEYRVKPEEKQYRPYDNSAEMIADFIDRFKVNCPEYCEPLIWVKSKKTGYRHLITTFYGSTVMLNTDSPVCCSLWQLYEFYTYLDGSPCGMEAKE